MTLYLDTSLLIAIFTNEIASERSRDWLRSHEHDPKMISWWVETETAAALSVKFWSGQINAEQRALLMAGIKGFVSTSVTVQGVVQAHFVAGSQIADAASLGLRAGDALHLAIAQSHGATLCTLDRQLAAAGPEAGVDTVLV